MYIYIPKFQIRNEVIIKVVFCWKGREPHIKRFSLTYLSVKLVISELFLTVLASGQSFK